MTSKEEAQLINAVEESILEANNGASANDAIQKTAEKYGLGPAHIEAMVGAFNKSKSVHIMKEAEEKAATFEIADASVIVKNIYSPTEQKEASFSLPYRNMSTIDMESTGTQKEAMQKEAVRKTVNLVDKPWNQPKTKASVLSILDKQAAFQKRVKIGLDNEAKYSRHKMIEAIDKVAEELLSYSPKQYKKTCQMLVNGYSGTGATLVKYASAKCRKELPSLEKTASAVVFPPKEPFISALAAHEFAEKVAKAENALKRFEKESADSFLQDFLANVSADSLAKKNLSYQGLHSMLRSDQPDKKKIEDNLSPDISNQLREIETTNQFRDLALYDNDLKEYDFDSLVTAFNTAKQEVPSGNQHIVKNLMMRNLEQGSVRDPFEMASSATLEKTLSEMQNKKKEFAIKSQELGKQAPTAPYTSPVTPDEGMGRSISKILGNRAENILKGVPSDKDKQRDAFDKKRNDPALKAKEDSINAQFAEMNLNGMSAIGVRPDEVRDIIGAAYDGKVDPGVLKTELANHKNGRVEGGSKMDNEYRPKLSNDALQTPEGLAMAYAAILEMSDQNPY